MRRGIIWLFGFLSIISFAISAYFIYQYSRYPKLLKGLVPLKSVLSDQGERLFRGEFTTQYSEMHYIGIVFPKSISDFELAKLVENWRSFGLDTKDRLPRPDLHWEILNEDKIIGKGDGGQINTTYFIGDALVCGEFQVKSGRSYIVQVHFGPDFLPFLKYSTGLEIGVSRAAVSVGLAWMKEKAIQLIYTFAMIGFFFLILSIYLHFRYRKKGERA